MQHGVPICYSYQMENLLTSHVVMPILFILKLIILYVSVLHNEGKMKGNRKSFACNLNRISIEQSPIKVTEESLRIDGSACIVVN